MLLVWPTPSLVARAQGEVLALAFLASNLVNRIHLALVPGLVQGVKHSFGTQTLGYCSTYDSVTEHVDDNSHMREFRQGRHVELAPAREGMMSPHWFGCRGDHLQGAVTPAAEAFASALRYWTRQG